ncbi:hypothetical protein KAH94_02550 [bacterium]|nr:hypothetical protein [bacterium]
MKYRNFCFIFAFITFYSSSNNKITFSVDQFMTDEISVADEMAITRRGIINEISEALEGVLAVTEDVLNIILLPIKQLIKLDQEAILQNQHKSDVAMVRQGGPLCQGELNFREKRFPIVKKAQEKLLAMNLEDEDVLEIAFSGSGGSMRAKAFSLGACYGADKIGLLDTAMYMSGLSGTTWFLAPWISSGLPLGQYYERAMQDICYGLDIDDIDDLEPILDSLWTKFAFNQHINIIDIYGGLLGNNLLSGFGKKQHMIYLSDQQKTIADGIFPMPIYNAVLAERHMKKHWFEFTPFEVGSRWLGAYIPSWSFGRKFKKGKSCSKAPEMSLGFMMGICGSAFAASFQEAYDKCFKNIRLPKFLSKVPAADKIFNILKGILKKLALSTELGDIRIAWGQVFNYVYKMEKSVYRDYQDLKLIDAGVEFNNPIFSTYRKPPYADAPDVIFVFDATSVVSTTEIKGAQDYASLYNLKFPKIDTDDVLGKALTVYGDINDLDVPLILFMPRTIDYKLLSKNSNNEKFKDHVRQLKDFDIEEAVNLGFAFSGNFKYTREQADLIVGLGEFNVRALEQTIKEILKKRIEAKRKKRMLNK